MNCLNKWAVVGNGPYRVTAGATGGTLYKRAVKRRPYDFIRIQIW